MKSNNIKFFFFLILIHISFFSLAICQLTTQPGIDQLIHAGACISEDIQTDFGRRDFSSSYYLEAWPSSTQEVASLVKIAYEHHISIRTQGAAHSENGSSLPQRDELLIHTTKLMNIKFENVDSIIVDAGVSIYMLNQMLKKTIGYFLPVINGGGPGPSVGGFISAGGISNRSGQFGGLWENIRSITLVTGFGKIMQIKKGDALFLSLFGSMGQLGIITEAELDVLPIADQSKEYPIGTTSFIDYTATDGRHWQKNESEDPLYWLNLFVSSSRLSEAQSDLLFLQNKYPQAMNYAPIYQWEVININEMPPLLYDRNESFIAIGIWGKKLDSPKNREELFQLNDEFSQLVLENNYKRYIQAESTGSPSLYKRYFSEKTYNDFKNIKTVLDPNFLFNKGSFFEDEII